MHGRRRVLATLGAGIAGALAGCGSCDPPPSRELVFAAEQLSAAGSGWELGVAATTTFRNPRRGAKIGGLDVAAYSRDRRVLGHETIGDVAWADVPEEQRSDGRCGTAGSIVSNTTLSVPEVPYYVGPRFLDGGTVRAFETDGTSGFNRIVALRYGNSNSPMRPVSEPTVSEPTGDRGQSTTAEPATATTDKSATAADETTAAIGTGSAGEWPPSDPSADAYSAVEVRDLPWPRPSEQAIAETPTFSAVRFRGTSACSLAREPPRLRQFGSSDETDVRIRWSRPIPSDSCLRPFLTGVSYDEGVLTIRVGLHEVSYVVCRPCDRLPYEFRATFRRAPPPELTRVVIEHRTDGELVERTVVQPG